jgi:hypothetical protein
VTPDRSETASGFPSGFFGGGVVGVEPVGGIGVGVDVFLEAEVAR